MISNLTDSSVDRLVPLKYLAGRLGVSPRKVKRDFENQPGFPKSHKLGHRTVLYSRDDCDKWFDDFKSSGKQSSER